MTGPESGEFEGIELGIEFHHENPLARGEADADGEIKIDITAEVPGALRGHGVKQRHGVG